MPKDKRHKSSKHKDKHKDRKRKHSDGVKKKHKKKEKHKRRSSSDSSSDSSSSNSAVGARRSVITGKKLKLRRAEDEASQREEARREAIRQAMNGEEGEMLGVAEQDAPKSSIERAVAEKLKDKEGMHRMMLAKAEHAKFQLATGIGLDKTKQKGGFFPDRGRTAGGY